MILDIKEAQVINPNITQIELDALEEQVRNLSNNNFHNKNIRNSNLAFENENLIISASELVGYKPGDTIEVVDTKFNDGLWIVSVVEDEYSLMVEVSDTRYLTQSREPDALIAKVEYPVDIAVAIKEILKYKTKMANKIGIKSESIARKSTTYFDVNGTDNVEGVPSSFWSFIKKYRKIKW